MAWNHGQFHEIWVIGVRIAISSTPHVLLPLKPAADRTLPVTPRAHANVIQRPKMPGSHSFPRSGIRFGIQYSCNVLVPKSRIFELFIDEDIYTDSNYRAPKFSDTFLHFLTRQEKA